MRFTLNGSPMDIRIFDLGISTRKKLCMLSVPCIAKGTTVASDLAAISAAPICPCLSPLLSRVRVPSGNSTMSR